MSSPNSQIDNVDKAILSILAEDASVPYTEIAKRLVVSPGTIHVRMKKMQELGVVHGSHIAVNPQKIGYDICAFIGIFIDNAGIHGYSDAVKKMQEVPEIVELHYTTGVYSMFAKVMCRDTENLRKVLNERIRTIPGVHRTETFLSLEESIRRPVKIE